LLVIVLFIEVLDGAIQKKKKKRFCHTKKPAGKRLKSGWKPIEKSLNKIDTQTIELIESTIEDICDDYGWAFLGDVGNLIVKENLNDPRNYGFAKLTPMLKSLTDILEIDERDSEKKGLNMFLRLRFSGILTISYNTSF
jgi:hypothetical protein